MTASNRPTRHLSRSTITMLCKKHGLAIVETAEGLFSVKRAGQTLFSAGIDRISDFVEGYHLGTQTK